MTDEMRYRGNALLRDSIVGKVELLHVAAVTDAVEEKRQSLVANVASPAAMRQPFGFPLLRCYFSQ